MRRFSCRVYGVLVEGDKVLLTRSRFGEKTFINFPGGGVEIAEAPGDALIAPNGKLKTVPVENQEDPAALKKSLELLRTYDFDHLLVGDGDPLLGDAKSAVVAFLNKK